MTGNHIIDPQVKALMESAAIGEAARLFLRSDMGAYLTQRAAAEADEAMSELIDADPGDAKLIAAIQQRIRVASQAIGWLVEAMSEGDNALRALEEES
ncbi:MAG: hypothetical protein WC023_01515 [Rhodocyclaceae bacterium]